METLKPDINLIEKLIFDYAEKARVNIFVVDIKEVKPEESIRLKCLVPVCENYGTSKVCPPNIPSVKEFKRCLKKYKKAFLVVLLSEIKKEEMGANVDSAEQRLTEVMNHLDRITFENGHYWALGLGSGGCKLCRKCTPVGEPCRHPYKARPSPNGFGIDITELARTAGVPVEWPPITKLTFMGLLLI